MMKLGITEYIERDVAFGKQSLVFSKQTSPMIQLFRKYTQKKNLHQHNI